MTKIIGTKITETKNFIKGSFRLSDKSTTFFEITKKTGFWEQWGNTRENLCLSVPKIEAILEESLQY